MLQILVRNITTYMYLQHTPKPMNKLYDWELPSRFSGKTLTYENLSNKCILIQQLSVIGIAFVIRGRVLTQMRFSVFLRHIRDLKLSLL